MRFDVPQFIEIEDKIIGPFTWKQFIYLAGGTGLLVILYFFLPSILFVLIGMPLGALAGFLAFHRINNRPFSIFLESFISYMTHTKLYLWKREEEQSIISYSDEYLNAQQTSSPTRTGGIHSLAKKLELNALEKDHEG